MPRRASPHFTEAPAPPAATAAANAAAATTAVNAAAATAAANAAEDDHVAVCAICLEPMTDDASAVPLSCSHRFHAACLIPWLQKGNRSCPTCREKPPRQRFDGSESEGSGYGSGYGNDTDGYGSDSDGDAAHRELHVTWDVTWAAWLASYRTSEALRKRAMTKAKKMASAARTRDPPAQKEAKRLARSLEQWQEKVKARKQRIEDIKKASRVAEQRRTKKRNEVWKWHRKQYEALEKKRQAKMASVSQACLKLERDADAAERAMHQAAKAASSAEAKLAKAAGWEELAWSDHPILPAELEGCIYDPYHGGPNDHLAPVAGRRPHLPYYY